MANYSRAKMAYSSSESLVRTDRNIEYDIFAKVTGELRNTSETKKQNYSDFVTALQKNRELWNLLASAVSDKENKLPQETRASLFFLSEFTNYHTSEALKSDISIGPLLEINSSIMAGLQSTSATA